MSRIAPFVTVLASVLLAGCAATPNPTLGSVERVSYRTDSEYVTRVEDSARRSGIQVVWVNPPRERVVKRD